MRTKRHLALGLLATVLGLTGLTAQARAGTGVVVETISDYSYYVGDHHGDTDADAEGAGFLTTMFPYPPNPNNPYHVTAWWYDNAVTDTGFYDPELTGNPIDHDTNRIDMNGVAMSFMIGHGGFDDQQHLSCTSNADCTAHWAGSYCSAGGMVFPYFRTCVTEVPKCFITSSSSSSHGNVVCYGKYHGGADNRSMALGESVASGGFNGAGTNGGINELMMIHSIGFRYPYLLDETAHFFGGLHGFMFAMPTGLYERLSFPTPQWYESDTAQWTDRGATLANNILANLNAPVQLAWRSATMVAYGFTSNDPNMTYPYGAQWMMARDYTYSAALFHKQSETWNQAILDTGDAIGNAYWAGGYTCNYDCVTYGL